MINVVGFSLATLLLIVGLIDLFATIKRHNLASRMTNEMRLLTIIGILFASSYLIFIGWDAYLFTFTKDSGLRLRYMRKCLNYGLPLLLDVPPIGLVLYYHFKNFKVHKIYQ